MSKACFVTVGTTRFDALINRMLDDDVIEALIKLEIKRVVMQIGAGEFNAALMEKFNMKDKFETTGKATIKGVDFEFYRFKNDIKQDIVASKFVIGHCGAGTVLDVLEANKPLVVVINPSLMDNHQVELAEQFAADGFLLHCNIADLTSKLCDSALFQLREYLKPPFENVARYLDKRLGVCL